MPPELGQTQSFLEPPQQHPDTHLNNPTTIGETQAIPEHSSPKQSNTGLITATLMSLQLPAFTSPPITTSVLRQSFWFANRTPLSIQADRHIREYFYHCISNFDFPMRLNYCWNFSINHQRLIKKTLARPYKFSKVCARRAASVVGERILLKRDAASGRRDVAAEVKEYGGGVVVSVGAVVVGGKGEKKEKKKKRKKKRRKKKKKTKSNTIPITNMKDMAMNVQSFNIGTAAAIIILNLE